MTDPIEPPAVPVDRPPSPARSRSDFRTRHRAAQHKAAHDPATAAIADDIIHDPLVARSIEPLVATAQGLRQVIDALRSAGSFAYDSEFIGESSYHPRLYLVQVATTRHVWLIDPTEVGDLAAFWELLTDPSVEKLVHAGEQDLEPVVRHLGRAARNVFDTQIAAGFASMAYPSSLAKLVLEATGVKLAKGLTFTDWSQRPLSSVQLRYAADDVRYLPAVADRLKQKLQPAGYDAWARAESEAMGEPARFRFDPDADYLRVRGAGGLPPQNLAVLRELTAWRDAAAQQADAPPRGFLKDEVLIALARSPVRRADQLARIRGLPRPVEEKHADAILAATARGLSAEKDRPGERPVEPSPSQRFAADALWAVVQTLATGRGIDPNLLASRQDIGDLSRRLAADANVDDARLMTGWRRAAVGEDVLNLVRSRATFRLRWSEGLRADREHG